MDGFLDAFVASSIAANSRGFVLGFDDEHPYFESPSTDDSLLNRLFDVEYSAERPATEHMIQLPFRDILVHIAQTSLTGLRSFFR